MKKAVFCILVLLLVPNCVKLTQAIADETKRSGIAWYLNLQGYNLPHVLEKGMYALYMPRTLDCGEVQVTLQEVLYDGYWIFTVASVTPTSSKKTLVMPGSAGADESVSGGNGEKSGLDSRTFREAATEDGKRLLSVYVYPKEFDYLPFYFLDHRQDENDSSTWDITQEEVDWYRSVVDSIVISRLNPLTVLQDNQASLFTQFQDGNLDAQRFLELLDERVRYVYLENQ